MNYVHEKTGKKYELGRLIDFDGRTFDINVITKWDEENDFEESPILVDYYFGELDNDATDYCIDEFIKRQKGLKTALKFLKGKLLVDHEFMESDELEELKESIKVLKDMTTDLV